MKIYAPVKDFNGLRNNVRFVNGIGETDNPMTIEWFKSHGYGLENDNFVKRPQNNEVNVVDKVNLVIEPKNDENEPDFDAMTPFELREWGRANGFAGKIKNTRDKEKLLKIIKG